MRKLRRFYDPAELKRIYAETYDPTRWDEHVRRIDHTQVIASRLVERERLLTGADLSCGDASIIRSLGLIDIVTNDITSSGLSINEVVRDIAPVDLFICTETIEHLEAPWTVLERIAERTKWLILSTPLDEDAAIGNWEHYWSFELIDVRQMLNDAGFTDLRCTIISELGWTYAYQLWIARSRYA